MALSGRTQLVPILGHPADHIVAPAIYNAAFAAAGLDWVQVVLDVAPVRLPGTLQTLAGVGNLRGLNLTIPHKAAGHAACRRVGAQARATGVVNTLRLEDDGSWSGESFDGVGFVQAARAHGVLDHGRDVLLVGAGGAATAIAHALAYVGQRGFRIVDTDAARAGALCATLRARHPAARAHCTADPAGVGLAVNATPLGLHAGDALALDPTRLPADAAVFDIVAARETELMLAARARGLRTVGGRAMIDHQLAAQIAFWRGGDRQALFETTPSLER